MGSRKNNEGIETVFNNNEKLLTDVIIEIFLEKKKNIFVRWLDRVPRTLDFQAVKLTSEDSQRNQPGLSVLVSFKLRTYDSFWVSHKVFTLASWIFSILFL